MCMPVGNPDPQFFESRSAKKGRFKGKTLNTLAVVDDSVPSNRTIRSTKCSLLVSIQGSRCAACQSHRNVLRRQSYRTRAGPATRLKYAPHRVLNTPERQKKLQLLAKSKRNAQARIRRLVSKIDTAVEHDGVAVEPGVHEELQSIVNEKTPEMESKFPFGSFRLDAKLTKSIWHVFSLIGDCSGSNRKGRQQLKEQQGCDGIHS